MSYYDTIEDDLARAKEILARGKLAPDMVSTFSSPEVRERMQQLAGGTIYGADIYAAYKLLESFVAEIAHLRAAIKVDEQTITHNIATIEEQNATIARLRDIVAAHEEELGELQPKYIAALNGRAAAQAEVERLRALEDK